MFSIVDRIVSGYYWFRIFISPVLIASFFSFVLLFYFNVLIIHILAFILILLGVIVGYKWANYAKKKYGTIEYLGRTNFNSDEHSKQ